MHLHAHRYPQMRALLHEAGVHHCNLRSIAHCRHHMYRVPHQDPRQPKNPAAVEVRAHLSALIGNICSSSQTRTRPLSRPTRSAKSTQRPSSATCARNDSQEHTICDHTYAHTPMSVPLFARFAARHSLANMIVSDTKDFILARRSLFAGED